MNKNLLIVGAGTYAVVAYEIALDMGCFAKIDFVDDVRKATPNGIETIGNTDDIERFAPEYSYIVVAIGNPEARLSFLKRIIKMTPYNVVSLVSPRAYISPSAQIMSGCIIEPMATVQAGCKLQLGCIICAGAVVNHTSECGEGVHVDCNATVEGYSTVPAGTKICSGDVYKMRNDNL